MKRIHAATIAAILGVAAVGGTVAAVKTTTLGVEAEAASDAQIAQTTKAPDEGRAGAQASPQAAAPGAPGDSRPLRRLVRRRARLRAGGLERRSRQLKRLVRRFVG